MSKNWIRSVFHYQVVFKTALRDKLVRRRSGLAPISEKVGLADDKCRPGRSLQNLLLLYFLYRGVIQSIHLLWLWTEGWSTGDAISFFILEQHLSGILATMVTCWSLCEDIWLLDLATFLIDMLLVSCGRVSLLSRNVRLYIIRISTNSREIWVLYYSSMTLIHSVLTRINCDLVLTKATISGNVPRILQSDGFVKQLLLVSTSFGGLLHHSSSIASLAICDPHWPAHSGTRVLPGALVRGLCLVGQKALVVNGDFWQLSAISISSRLLRAIFGIIREVVSFLEDWNDTLAFSSWVITDPTTV